MEENYEEKMKEFRERIERNPSDLSVYFDRGMYLCNVGKYKESISDFSKTEKSDFVYFLRGVAFEQIGDYRSAYEDYSDAVRLNPKYTSAFLNRKNAFQKLSELDRKLVMLSDKIRVFPKDFVAYNNRGLCFLDLGDYNNAIQDFTTSLRISRHKFAVGLNNRGRTYCEIGEFEKAIGDLTEAIRLDTDLGTTTTSYINRGLAYDGMGDLKKAIDDLSEAIRINPKVPDAYSNRGGIYLSLREFERVVADCTIAIRMRPNYYQAYQNRGCAYFDLREFEKAFEDFSKAISLNPKFTPALRGRGNTLMVFRKYEDAIKDYSEAIRLNPEDYEAYYNRGRCFLESGEPNLCIKDQTSAIRIFPEYVFAYNRRGQAYTVIGNTEKAIEDFRTTIRIDPNNCMAYCLRARLYHTQGKLKEAVEDMVEAQFLNPKNSEQGSSEAILTMIGSLKMVLGDRESAMEYYNKAIEENPNNASTYEDRSRHVLLMGVDPERAIEDYFRVKSLRERQRMKRAEKYKRSSSDRVLPNEEFVKEEEEVRMKEIFKRLEVEMEGKKDEKSWFRFKKGSAPEREIEKAETEKLRALIQPDSNEKGKVHSFISQNLVLLRKLGSGSFCLTYLCRILGIANIFVIKVMKPFTNPNDAKRMRERDCVEIPNHPNIVITLSHFDCFVELQARKFPDFEEFWKPRMGGLEEFVIRTPVILMKYYRKTLKEYVDQRKKDPRGMFTDLEIGFMLQGLLHGIHHLYLNKIVHRDLHFGNVFVDETLGRIYIGDFGCCLDLRDREGFKVKKDDKRVLEFLSYSSFIECDLEVGGAAMFLAPEILDFDEEKEDWLDYSKNDLFSVGILGYYLMTTFLSELLEPFGTYWNEHRERVPITKGREQYEFDEIAISTYDESLAKLITKMLFVDPKRRIDVFGAVQEIEKVQEILDKEDLKKMRKILEDEDSKKPLEERKERSNDEIRHIRRRIRMLIDLNRSRRLEDDEEEEGEMEEEVIERFGLPEMLALYQILQVVLSMDVVLNKKE